MELLSTVQERKVLRKIYHKVGLGARIFRADGRPGPGFLEESRVSLDPDEIF